MKCQRRFLIGLMLLASIVGRVGLLPDLVMCIHPSRESHLEAAVNACCNPIPSCFRAGWTFPPASAKLSAVDPVAEEICASCTDIIVSITGLDDSATPVKASGHRAQELALDLVRDAFPLAFHPSPDLALLASAASLNRSPVSPHTTVLRN